MPSLQSPRIVFLGDSVTMQIFFSIACKLNVRFRHVEAVPGRTGINAEHTAHWIGTTYENIIDQANFGLYDLHLGKGSISLIYSKRSISKEYRAEGMATMLKEAFASPIVKSLLQDAFYVVNFGLWHAVCTTDNNPMVFKFANQGQEDSESCNDPQYQWRLTQLFEQLLKSTRGPILWRDTTAVHPSRLPENVNKETREKYKHFDNVAIASLNANATQLIASNPRFAARIQSSPSHWFYAATRDRADGTLPTDMRHYDAEVVDQLIRVLFLQVCEVL